MQGASVDEVLMFELDGARYGLPASLVRKIVRAVQPAPVPGLSPGAALEGLVDLHGEVVPLFDLRAAFGLPARPVAASDHLVVLDLAARAVVVRADAVLGLLAVEASALAEARGLTGPLPYLAGVLRLPDGLVLLADPERFLTGAEELALRAVS